MFICGSFASDRPNFIVILADDLGYADLSCYGNDRFSTPHIDRLAAEGVRFTDFHASCPVCSPTRAALLTGRYQQRAGMPEVIFRLSGRNRHEGLQPDQITFAELLGHAEYRTAAFGKWHLGYEQRHHPVRHGFEHFRGYISGYIDYHNHLDPSGADDWWVNLERVPEEGYSTHLITKYAVQFIREHRDGPFCLYVAHQAPHDPYQGPGDPPIRVRGQAAPGTRGAGGRVRPDAYPPGQVERAYPQMVRELDEGVGRIVATVWQLGLAENTLIFFLSDNGATPEGDNGLLRGFKRSLWEGGHRVPGIAWWPGRIAPGGVSDQTIICIDIMPTLLELAGVALPYNHRLDGVSLVPLLLRGEPGPPDRMIFWQYQTGFAARQGPWKLIYDAEDSRGAGEPDAALFNLADDLGEKHDLAAAHPGRVHAMRAAIERWYADMTENAAKQPPRPQEE